MDVGSLADRVAAQEQWYHTIELAPGVVTPGWFDTRPIVSRLPMPQSLAGRRCLDVGTFDGFWAFEMERRGAAEVVAIDVLDPAKWDWPVSASAEAVAEVGRRKQRGEGFDIAAHALDSKVQRHELSVYDLDPATIGEFDFVYVGSLLLHLRDPVHALEQVRAVCRGRMLSVDAYDIGLTLAMPRRPVARLDGLGRPWWWKPNLAALVRMVDSAGFRVVGKPVRFYMPAGAGHPPAGRDPKVLRHRAGREHVLRAVKGDPHAAILAEPVGR